MIEPVQRTVWRFFKKLGIKPPYDPTISLLGTCPEKTIGEKETCTSKATAALLTTARTGRELMFTDRGTDKEAVVHVYNRVFSSVAQLCLTLCNPTDCSMPGFPVHHQLPELAQTHAHQVGDAIQPSHPLLSPSPPAFNFSQDQGFFK